MTGEPREQAGGLTEGTLAAIGTAARSKAGTDPAHDWLHVARVERLGAWIAEESGACVGVVRAAALLHEVINLPKHHPDSHRSGELCAHAALEILQELGVDDATARAVAGCIRVHGFSAGLEPDTLEGKVLQDADRLDAIGAIGIARCFATCASMQRPFYDDADPFCRHRRPDDHRFGLDHFERKLLRIPERLHTDAARRLAHERATFVRLFLDQFESEIESCRT
jgi:uncharacterized protein